MDDRYNYDEYQYGADGKPEATFEKRELEEMTTEDVFAEYDESSVAELEDYNTEGESSQENEIQEDRVKEDNENKGVNFILQETQEHKYEQYAYDDIEKKATQTEVKKDTVVNKADSKKTKKWMSCVAGAVIFGLIASFVFQASNRLMNGIFGDFGGGKEVVMDTTPVSTTSDVKVLSDVSEVAKNVMPSVVAITCLTVQEVQSYFFGDRYTQQYESSGSGIIIGQNERELLIVTNNHVVDGSSVVTVTFADDTSLEAQIKGTDADIDVAILSVPLDKIEESTSKAIKIANLGDSDQLTVGEPTIAIGNALGYGQTVTNGIVSALGRTMEGLETGLIQTNAAINPGNSGGALLNAAGEVIGINTAKISGEKVEGLGFAIPISDIQEVLGDLMSKVTRDEVAEAERGTIGIQVESIDETVSQMYGMPEGAFVKDIVKGGAAEKAGIPKGAIITKFDGTRIKNREDLFDILIYYRAGETVEVTTQIYGGNGEYIEKVFELKLGTQKDLQ